MVVLPLFIAFENVIFLPKHLYLSLYPPMPQLVSPSRSIYVTRHWLYWPNKTWPIWMPTWVLMKASQNISHFFTARDLFGRTSSTMLSPTLRTRSLKGRALKILDLTSSKSLGSHLALSKVFAFGGFYAGDLILATWKDNIPRWKSNCARFTKV